jgi:hypothetical protein
MWIIFGGSGTVHNNWSSAWLGDPSNPNYYDPDFELIGSQIFRFEYFFLLSGVDPNTGQTLALTPPSQGFGGIAAICVNIAAIDQKSRVLLSNDNIDTLIGRLADAPTFTATSKISDLPNAWQAALDASTDMPGPAISGIRIYQRSFDLWY